MTASPGEGAPISATRKWAITLSVMVVAFIVFANVVFLVEKRRR